jgi:hypothetical protein
MGADLAASDPELSDARADLGSVAFILGEMAEQAGNIDLAVRRYREAAGHLSAPKQAGLLEGQPLRRRLLEEAERRLQRLSASQPAQPPPS